MAFMLAVQEAVKAKAAAVEDKANAEEEAAKGALAAAPSQLAEPEVCLSTWRIYTPFERPQPSHSQNPDAISRLIISPHARATLPRQGAGASV
eukprot:COSAG04_NODE_2776_length_3600_cov_2.598686_3_plen_92_part_01